MSKRNCKMQKTKQKFYLGDILINGKQVSAFVVAPTKKRAAEIFDCSSNYLNSYFEIWDIQSATEDERFKIAVEYPEKLFVTNSGNNPSNDDYRLFIDKDRFLSSSKLITDVKQKELYLKSARKSKTKFLKIRLKDNIALRNDLLVDLYLDITKLSKSKSFFYIPFSDKLIDDTWQHCALKTEEELSFIFENMIDIYDEIVTPFFANEALDFVKIG